MIWLFQVQSERDKSEKITWNNFQSVCSEIWKMWVNKKIVGYSPLKLIWIYSLEFHTILL